MLCSNCRSISDNKLKAMSIEQLEGFLLAHSSHLSEERVKFIMNVILIKKAIQAASARASSSAGATLTSKGAQKKKIRAAQYIPFATGAKKQPASSTTSAAVERAVKAAAEATRTTGTTAASSNVTSSAASSATAIPPLGHKRNIQDVILTPPPIATKRPPPSLSSEADETEFGFAEGPGVGFFQNTLQTVDLRDGIGISQLLSDIEQWKKEFRTRRDYMNIIFQIERKVFERKYALETLERGPSTYNAQALQQQPRLTLAASSSPSVTAEKAPLSSTNAASAEAAGSHPPSSPPSSSSSDESESDSSSSTKEKDIERWPAFQCLSMYRAANNFIYFDGPHSYEFYAKEVKNGKADVRCVHCKTTQNWRIEDHNGAPVFVTDPTAHHRCQKNTVEKVLVEQLIRKKLCIIYSTGKLGKKDIDKVIDEIRHDIQNAGFDFMGQFFVGSAKYRNLRKRIREAAAPREEQISRLQELVQLVDDLLSHHATLTTSNSSDSSSSNGEGDGAGPSPEIRSSSFSILESSSVSVQDQLWSSFLSVPYRADVREFLIDVIEDSDLEIQDSLFREAAENNEVVYDSEEGEFCDAVESFREISISEVNASSIASAAAADENATNNVPPSSPPPKTFRGRRCLTQQDKEHIEFLRRQWPQQPDVPGPAASASGDSTSALSGPVGSAPSEDEIEKAVRFGEKQFGVQSLNDRLEQRPQRRLPHQRHPKQHEEQQQHPFTFANLNDSFINFENRRRRHMPPQKGPDYQNDDSALFESPSDVAQSAACQKAAQRSTAPPRKGVLAKDGPRRSWRVKFNDDTEINYGIGGEHLEKQLRKVGEKRQRYYTQ